MSDVTVVANNLGKALIPDLTCDIVTSDNRTPRHKLIFDQSPRPGTIVSIGTHTIRITIYDQAGNSRTRTMTVDVVDDDVLVPQDILSPGTDESDAVIELALTVVEIAFDGTYVNLTWEFPDGIPNNGTVYIARDGSLYATATGTTYTDTAPVSGASHSYLITYVTTATLAAACTSPICVPGGDAVHVFENGPQTYTADCPVGTTGDSVTVTIPAGTYTSTISQAAADALALVAAADQAVDGLCCQVECEECEECQDNVYPYGFGYENCLDLYEECYPYGYGYAQVTSPPTGIFGWYKADALSLSDNTQVGIPALPIPDSTGNGRALSNISVPQPWFWRSGLLNGKPIFRSSTGIDVSLSEFNQSALFPAGWTIGVVARRTAYNGTYDPGGAPAFAGITNSATALVIRPEVLVAGTTTVWRGYGEGVGSVIALSESISDWQVVTLRITESNHIPRMRTNGQSLNGAVAISDIVIDHIYMQGVDTDWAEMIHYNRYLNDAEMYQLRFYLASKYNIAITV